jgi:hypothetical protein
MAHDDKPYAVQGNKQTEQAEASTANRGAGTLQMRLLIELQVISYLLHQQAGGTAEDLGLIRQEVANSIT